MKVLRLRVDTKIVRDAQKKEKAKFTSYFYIVALSVAITHLFTYIHTYKRIFRDLDSPNSKID